MAERDLNEVKVKRTRVKKNVTAEKVEPRKATRKASKIDDVATKSVVVAEPKKVDDIPLDPASVAKKIRAQKTPVATKVLKTQAKVVSETPAKTRRPRAKVVEIVEEEKTAPVAKAKRTRTKAAPVLEAKVEPKLLRKPRAKKAAPKIDAETSSSFLEIQTRENSDLSESAPAEGNLSPIFKALAEPKLPVLKEENRVFLQIQSPTRIFFSWSLKSSVADTLPRALGNRAAEYFMAIRLVNLDTQESEIHRVGNRGSWWFNDISADTKYRGEVGFYAPNRPFVRIVFSNTLQTPRLKPSENTAFHPYFAATSEQFAEVLELAGYSQDAFELHLLADEPKFAEEAMRRAFPHLVSGDNQFDFTDIDVKQLRQVLSALASGVLLDSLRGEISNKLFAFLSALTEQSADALTEENIIDVLEEFFGFTPFEKESGVPTVFGASSINFPERLRSNPKTFSSFSLK